MIVDTHTHVISPDTERFPLQVADHMPNAWVHEAALTSEELLSHLDAAGVGAAVLVQARTAYGYDNSYVAHARTSAPARLAATAIVNMSAPDRLAQLHRLAEDGLVTGVRLFNIPAAADGWFAASELAAFVRDAHAAGVRVSVCILPPDLPALGRLLAAVPEVPIALDHCGFVNPAVDPTQLQGLQALGGYANLRLKVTTTFLAASTDLGSDPRDLVEDLCARFGAGRLMWGSDFPQYHRVGYSEIVAFAEHAVSRLSTKERSAFLGGTALEIWSELRPGR